MKQLRGFLINFIWIVVVLIVLAGVGKMLLDVPLLERGPPEPRTTVTLPEPIPWETVDADVVVAFAAARLEATEFAEARVGAWIDGLMVRVDADFLDWYFNYWSQQVLGLESLWYASVHTVLAEQPTATEKITERIQEEFAARVLRPQVAQLELENIVRQVMERYSASLREHLSAVPEHYGIPVAEWHRYLDDISIMTSSTEGARGVPLTAKTLYAAGTGATVALAGQAAVIANKIGGQVAAKSAGKAAAKLATKTGTKVAAKAGGKLLGPIVGVGIVVWDVWDHAETERQNRPILRETMVDYFAEMKDSLLHDPENGVLTGIHRIELSMVESLAAD